jgi:glycerol kinase
VSASIESWVLQNIESVKKLRNTPFLAFGTIDTWLVYKLTGGKVHATDYSNMSCTGLCFLIVRLFFEIFIETNNTPTTGIYDPFIEGYGTIASMLSLPLQSMPDVRATNAGFGTTARALFGAAIPIGAVVGDQQAACFAQRCGRAGAANVIYCIV